MSVVFTNAKALLVTQASTLSTQATQVGLSSLATALTNLATEISGSSLTEAEFFGNGSTNFTSTGGTGGATPTGGSASGSGVSYGGAAKVWSQILQTASNIIASASTSSISSSILDLTNDADTSISALELIVDISNNIITLPGPLNFDPTGFFIQGNGIFANTYIISYYSETESLVTTHFLKTNQVAYSTDSVVNGDPLKFGKVYFGSQIAISIVSPAVMSSINMSLMREQAVDVNGIRTTGPYEWLSMSSLLKLYDEQGVDINKLKEEFEKRVPKSF